MKWVFHITIKKILSHRYIIFNDILDSNLNQNLICKILLELIQKDDAKKWKGCTKHM